MFGPSYETQIHLGVTQSAHAMGIKVFGRWQGLNHLLPVIYIGRILRLDVEFKNPHGRAKLFRPHRGLRH
jgi:hypothetical protein